MRTPTRLLVGLLAASSASCSLETGALRLERDRLRAEIQDIAGTAQVLGANAPFAHDVEFFVSYDFINDVLSGATGIEAPVPGIKGAIIRLGELDATGAVIRPALNLAKLDGSPQIEVDATAIKGRLKIHLAVRAELVTEEVTADKAVMQVHIVDIKPDLSVGCVSLGELWFARRLLTVEAEKVALARLRFELPLRSSTTISVPPVVQQIEVPLKGGGTLRGTVRQGGLPTSFANVSTPRLLFLRDGIHVLLTTDVGH